MTISPLEAQQLSAQGATMIDVREYPEWTAAHVAGAQLLPLGELCREPNLKDKFASDEPILVLCRSGKRAGVAAQALEQNGIEARVIEGGILAWQEAGLPVEKARGPIALERQIRIAAGSLVLLGLLVPNLRAISYFVGAGLVFAGVTDKCGMALLLAKAPWNRKR